jgi:hypothetical protein
MKTAQKTVSDRRQNFQKRLRHAVRKANDPMFAVTARKESPRGPVRTRPH